MARISAGQDFGQGIARPTRYNETATPAAAFGGGVGESLVHIGRGMEAQEQQVARERAHEARVQEQEARQQRDAADRAMAGARMGVLSDRLGDLVGEIDRGVQDGSIPKTEAGRQWQERSAKVLEDGLPEVPESHRETARVGLQGQAERLTSKVGDAVRMRDRTDTAAGITQTLEHSQRLAVTDPAGARRLMTETLDSLGPAAGLNADQIAKAKQGWVEGTAYTRAFAAVQGARSSNEALAKVDQAIAADSDLDPQRKAQLQAQVENYRANNEARALRQAQHGEIVAARQQRESDSAFSALSGWIMAGKAANPDAAAGLIAKLSPTALAAYREMAKEVPARAAAAMQPLQAQQQQIDALIVHRNANGTSEALEKEIDRRQKVLDSSRTDYAAEPLRAAAERGVLAAVQPLDMSSFDSLVAGIGVRVQQAETVSTRTGQPVSPLLGAEAQRLGTLLGSLPPDRFGSAVASLAVTLPPGQMGALAKQVDARDRPLALAMAAGTDMTTEGRSTAELIRRGQQFAKDKSVKEDQGAELGLRAQIAKEVGEAVPAAARQDVIDAARLIYMGKQGEGNTISAAGAVRLAIAGDIVEHNGRRVPVATGVTDLAARLLSYPHADIAAQAPDGYVYLPGGRPMGVPEFLAALPGAQLEPAGRGRYTVRSGGSLVTNQERRPIMVEVR